MNGTIYCLENHLTDKMYIGKTVDFKDRMRKYATGHCHKGALRNAILKYGWQHFSVKVVEEIPIEDLDDAERFWIAFLDTKVPNGYNLQDGGEGGKLADSTKELLRESALRRVEDGTHHFVTDNPSQRCMEEETHHFLTDNPSQNPEIVAKKERNNRKKKGIIDWVDMQQED